MLRRHGFGGSVTILSADNALPYDRPNLSKDYLAGTASEDWIPLRTADFYAEQKIDVRLGARVASIDPVERAVALSDGSRIAFDALLIATGADPVRLDIPGADLPHVHYLRTFDDSRDLIAKAASAKRVVVIGASFIGLETAASLRTRGIEVHVVGPQPRPLERVLGPELGDMVKAIHEEHGVIFHLGTSVSAIEKDAVILKTGERLAADLVVAGIGVRPDLGLAKDAGLTIDNGIVVDQYLQTSVPGIYAAGDIARWPDPAQRRSDPRRALGRRRAARPNRRAQYPRRQRAVRCRAVLLEPALRRDGLIRRPCPRLGQGGNRRRSGRPRLQGDVLSERPETGGRHRIA